MKNLQIAEAIRRVQDMLCMREITYMTLLYAHEYLGKLATALVEEEQPVMRSYHVAFHPSATKCDDMKFFSSSRREAIQGICTMCVHIPSSVESMILYENGREIAAVFFNGYRSIPERKTDETAR